MDMTAVVSVLTVLGGMVGVAWTLRGDLDARFSQSDEKMDEKFAQYEAKTEVYQRCVLREMTMMSKSLIEIEGRIALGNQWHVTHESEDVRRFTDLQRQIEEVRRLVNMQWSDHKRHNEVN